MIQASDEIQQQIAAVDDEIATLHQQVAAAIQAQVTAVGDEIAAVDDEIATAHQQVEVGVDDFVAVDIVQQLQNVENPDGGFTEMKREGGTAASPHIGIELEQLNSDMFPLQTLNRFSPDLQRFILTFFIFFIRRACCPKSTIPNNYSEHYFGLSGNNG